MVEHVTDEAEQLMRQRAKAMMRRRARSVRGSIPAGALATRSVALRTRLMGLPEIARAASIALFWPMERHKEVDLRPLFDEFAATKRIAFPAIDPADGGQMTLRWVASPSELSERGRGFCEPAPEAERASAIDLIVVPGLMFDACGYRIGYGAGYYDRTLPLFRPPALAVGVAFDFQLAPEIPTHEDDVAVDLVVTDARVLDLRG